MLVCLQARMLGLKPKKRYFCIFKLFPDIERVISSRRSPSPNYPRPQGLITEAPGDKGRHAKSKRLLLFLPIQAWQLRCCWPGKGGRASGGHIWESNALRQSNHIWDELFGQQNWFNTQSHRVNCCRSTNVGCALFSHSSNMEKAWRVSFKRRCFLGHKHIKGDLFLWCKANTDKKG